MSESLPWPDGFVYWSPRFHTFQDNGKYQAWVLRQAMAVWDLGTGKSHLGLGLAGLGFELGEIDLVLIICKKNKLADDEWPSEVRQFTTIKDFAVYHGPKRKPMLESGPRLIITTYEAIRSDAVTFVTSRKLADGPFMAFLRGKRVLVIYDEITKLGNRSSALYKAHHYVLTQLRKEHPDMRVYGLTGTPIERNWENAFNEMRLIWPQGMPTVAGFEEMAVQKRVLIPTGKNAYSGFEKVIWDPEGVRKFTALCAPRMLRVRKTDPAVAAEFPPLTEEYVTCSMKPDQARIYRLLEDLAWDDHGNFQQVPGLSMMLRLFAGHPRAILESAANGRSKLAQMLADEMPELESCSSAKTEELMEFLGQVVGGQQDRVMIFTFFARTVLPVLAKLIEKHYPLFIYDGGPGSEAAKTAFRQHEGAGAVLLCSDAGADGINVPETDYLVEYEPGRTHAIATQRRGRGHRLGRTSPLVCLTYTTESTVDTMRMIPAQLERNEQQDIFLGDEGAEGYTSAADRRELFAIARRRKRSP